VFELFRVLFRVCKLEGSKSIIFSGLLEGTSFGSNLATALAGRAKGAVGLGQVIGEQNGIKKLFLSPIDLKLHGAFGKEGVESIAF
jgi:hypothetical protein